MTKKLYLALAAFIILLAGCTTVKSTSYLMDMAANQAYPADAAPELLLQAGDRLDIQVLSENPELSAPFQIVTGEKTVANVYTIDHNGEIDFPILGSLKVGGRTLKQVEHMMADKIISGGYIKHPTVKVDLDNFTVTVIGQSGNAVLPVKGNSINLLEAIAATGGIRGNSNIKEVTVIRTEDGTRTAYQVDLQSKDIFSSPAFFLHQNDIVYIKPKGSTLSSSGQMALSIASVLLTLGNIISNFILWSSR